MKASQQPAIELTDVTKRYGGKIGIKNLSLQVMHGEVFGFLGPNGAGKSTTINTILDLLKPEHGTISILGLDHHKDAKEVHRRLGYISGDMETDPSLTGQQYLKYVSHLRGSVNKTAINTLSERLHADLSTKIRHLSRGNRQKIGLVAALMHDPDILILDEPTSGLDPLIQAEFNAIISEYKKLGKTTFISSHILSEVQTICDRVGFIREGELIRVSTLNELTKNTGRNITVRFTKTIPKSLLAKLNGVSNLRHKDKSLTFTFSGDPNQLMRLLVSYPVDDILIREPDLEELFMSFYRKEEDDV